MPSCVPLITCVACPSSLFYYDPLAPAAAQEETEGRAPVYFQETADNKQYQVCHVQNLAAQTWPALEP